MTESTLETLPADRREEPTVEARLWGIRSKLPLGRLLLIDCDGEPSPCLLTVDGEGDAFMIQFDNDGLASFYTGPYQYLRLAPDQLKNIADVGRSAQACWDALDQFWTGESWEGWSSRADYSLACEEERVTAVEA